MTGNFIQSAKPADISAKLSKLKETKMTSNMIANDPKSLDMEQVAKVVEGSEDGVFGKSSISSTIQTAAEDDRFDLSKESDIPSGPLLIRSKTASFKLDPAFAEAMQRDLHDNYTSRDYSNVEQSQVAHRRMFPDLYDPKIARVMTQGLDKIYRSKDGWEMKFHREADDFFSDWTMFDPQGKKVTLSDQEHTSWHDWKDLGYEFFSYYDRYGRDGNTECDIKYHAAHFPQGTIVQVSKTVADRDNNNDISNDIFTVRSVTKNGVRSYLLEMEEVYPESNKTFRGQHRSINVGHVIRIVKRGTGPLVFNMDRSDHRKTMTPADVRIDEMKHMEEILAGNSFVPPVLHKGEILVTDEWSFVRSLIAVMPQAEHNFGKYINDQALFKHMAHMGLSRPVSVYTYDEHVGTVRFGYFGAVKFKPLVKWLKKNMHRILRNFDDLEKQEKEDDRRMCEDMAFD